MQAKRVISTVISIGLLVVSATFISGTLQVLHRSRRLLEVKKELAEVQEQKARLEEEAAYRQSPEFIEQEARNKLNMVKQGEEVYLKPKIVGDDLLGAADAKNEESAGFFTPITTKINGLFDRIREMLLLFQS